MSMLLIEGTFRVLKAAPDGDSIRFYPKNKNHWGLVPGGHNVRTNLAGGAQLRLDGIDALETHYAPKGGSLGTLRQPADLSDEASTALLDFLGFSSVKRDDRETVTSGKPPEVNGYIMTRFADTYGRPVAFVFTGNHPAASGSQVRLDLDDLRKSANYHLLKTGMAYPTYYSKLFHDIRKEMTAAVKGAREGRSGIWAKDVSESGFAIDDVADLAQSAYVMPKLFRRLSDYLALNDGNAGLGGFHDYLAQLDDRLYIISDAQKTGFDFVVNVAGKTVNMTKKPEDLIFDEK